VYVDDIVFGSTKKEWCDEFEALMKGEFQMSAMGELTFFIDEAPLTRLSFLRRTTMISSWRILNECYGGTYLLPRIATTPYEALKPKSKSDSDSPVNKTIVATSSTEAEYVVAANYCGQDFLSAVEITAADYGFHWWNLTELLASQTNDKHGLGYFSSESDSESLSPSCPSGRLQPIGRYNVVPPPTMGNFMPPKPDLVLYIAHIAVETNHSAFTVKLSPSEPTQDLSHTNRPSVPITEEWVSDSEDESKTTAPQIAPSFVQTSEHVKPFEHSDQSVEEPILAATPKPTSPKTNRSGKRKNKKTCFVCRSVDHLIKDLLTQSKPVFNTAVRQVSVVVPKIMVTRPRLVHSPATKSKSPIRRHITRSPSPKTSNSSPKVTTVKALVVSAAQAFNSFLIKLTQMITYVDNGDMTPKGFKMTDRRNVPSQQSIGCLIIWTSYRNSIQDITSSSYCFSPKHSRITILPLNPFGPTEFNHMCIFKLRTIITPYSFYPFVQLVFYKINKILKDRIGQPKLGIWYPNLEAVKKIFKYLKGQPKLGLWYPKESPLVLEAYSDSDYAGANKDKKSIIGGCQFLSRRLISWQYKKQTIMATSSTEAEYVVAANCCGQISAFHVLNMDQVALLCYYLLGLKDFLSAVEITAAGYGFHWLQPIGRYNVVPPPTTGNFMPPKPDLVFHTAYIAIETDHSAFTVKLSPSEPTQDLSHINRPSAPIIEEWVSNSEDESKTTAPQIAPSFVQTSDHVKPFEHSDQSVEEPILAATPKPTSPKTNRSGKRKNKKLVLCAGVGHTKQNASFPQKHLQKHMALTVVLTQSKPVFNTAVRQVSVFVPKIMVTRPRLAHSPATKSKSPIRRHISRSPSPKTSNSSPKVTTVKALVVSAAQAEVNAASVYGYYCLK
nr:uncharacterized mitochondrial protein AtMg00810-like [Tanacetum cinerariifolium]